LKEFSVYASGKRHSEGLTKSFQYRTVREEQGGSCVENPVQKQENMTKQRPEKRHYPRVIFRDPKQIAALISLSGEQEQSLVTSILNMGEGGLQISVERKLLNGGGIRQGEKVTLNRISGLSELEQLTDISMQVIWIMDNEYLEHVLIGTCFGTLTDEHQGVLRSFIENCLRKKCA
jgi:hypothetical protein